VRTLRHWRERFLSHAADYARMGWSPELRRRWEFYFAYCEAGFAERYLGDLQILLARPRFRGDSLLGALS
jgi:cyclopropane-fatty-acyl-phospholipid synthase